MSRASLYRRALALLERWPKDPKKEGVDLGETLRHLVSKEFPQGDLTKESSASALSERRLAAFERLAADRSLRTNPRVHPEATATGLGRKDLELVSSIQFLKEIGEEGVEEEEEEVKDKTEKKGAVEKLKSKGSS